MEFEESLIISIVIIAVQTVLIGYLIRRYIVKRRFFPLKERSAFLTILIMICSYSCNFCLFIGVPYNLNLGFVSPLTGLCNHLHNFSDSDL